MHIQNLEQPRHLITGGPENYPAFFDDFATYYVDFNREHLLNETRYRQLENGVETPKWYPTTSRTFMNFGSQTA